jgi:hypothetical protein
MSKLLISVLVLFGSVSIAQSEYQLPEAVQAYIADMQPIKKPLQCGDLTIDLYQTTGNHLLTLYGRHGVTKAVDLKTLDRSKTFLVARLVADKKWLVTIEPSKPTHRTELVAAIKEYDISSWSAYWCQRRYNALFASSATSDPTLPP